MSRPVEYTVVLASPQTQTLDIRMLVRNVAGTSLDVAMPAWRQGRYAILDPAGTVYNVQAAGATGTPLAIQKVDKATWRVTLREAPDRPSRPLPSDIVITYSVYANSLHDRTRHVDDTHAFLSGATVFLYVPERRKDPLALRVDAPERWGVSCGLEPSADDHRLFFAPDFDTLIDSPIETGIQERVSFVAGGKAHDLVMWGRSAGEDTDRFRLGLVALINAQTAFWGHLPYDRYLFILHVAPGLWGGTEHLNSTIMQVPPSAFENELEYQRLLSLASHELFHTWNVKRLRPSVLREPDLSRENYSDLLWFCEGTTSYYDDLFVVRAGLQNAGTFLALIAESIYQVRARPGSRVQSLAESSFDAWVKFNRPTPNDINTTVSFYESGALFSLLWDLTLRQASRNKVSLDSVLQEMYRAFPESGPGFAIGDLIETTSRLAGKSFDDFFARYVFGTETYPLEDVLEVVGLGLNRAEAGAKAYLGISVQDQMGGAIVRAVLSDGPAYTAGLNAGDELLAINNDSVSAEQFVKNLETRYNPGETLNLEIRRRGQPRRFAARLGTRPQHRLQVLPLKDPTSQQRDAFRSWLHQDFPQGS